ncbi:unnamed protein product [Cylindrotheca closterium]|uniref:Uncharacterized protein n=1 Tax=Cylindrotheca closterium TaxID=2856 RepID=A0AAD2FJL2_9STRA|nr:unnamed protein product [Cylindrotheca closterium]
MKFLCLLSPTKALAEKSCKEFTSSSSSSSKIAALSKPRSILLERAKELKQSEIKSMMKLSDTLAKLNYDRYQNFEDQPKYPAGWLFDGPSFQKLNLHDFSDDELDRLDSSLCILSGFYGLLRPKDPMQPYRLEMGTKLAVDGSKNLYEFWKQHGLTKQVAELAAAAATDGSNNERRCILNCASQEYSKVLDFRQLQEEESLQVVDVVFQAANGGRMASVYAKQARGMFVRYIAKANPTSLEALQCFTGDGHYVFASQSDDNNTLVFERHASPQSEGDDALWNGGGVIGTKPTKTKAATKKTTAAILNSMSGTGTAASKKDVKPNTTKSATTKTAPAAKKKATSGAAASKKDSKPTTAKSATKKRTPAAKKKATSGATAAKKDTKPKKTASTATARKRKGTDQPPPPQEDKPKGTDQKPLQQEEQEPSKRARRRRLVEISTSVVEEMAKKNPFDY